MHYRNVPVNDLLIDLASEPRKVRPILGSRRWAYEVLVYFVETPDPVDFTPIYLSIWIDVETGDVIGGEAEPFGG